jgi:hypothetical protein
LCDTTYGTIFCGDKDINIFPAFSTFVRNHTKEIRLVHTGIIKLPDFRKWVELKKIILNNNDNLICFDILKVIERNPKVKIISKCNEDNLKSKSRNNSMTTISMMTNLINTTLRIDTSDQSLLLSFDENTSGINNTVDTTSIEESSTLSSKDNIYYYDMNYITLPIDSQYNFENEYTTKFQSFEKSDEYSISINRENKRMYVTFATLGICLLLLFVTGIIGLIIYTLKLRSAEQNERNDRNIINLDHRWTFEEETAV